jgi:hypothetical protein
MEDKLVVFNNKSIRRIWFEDDWWFSVVDIVFALTDSNDAKDYWYRMKDRILLEEGSELSTICRQFKLRAIDGKNRLTDCSNTEGVFRIIQSIPSPKAEPFKRWLAKVGKERVDEINNPELAQERIKSIYEQKGYSKDWIDKRMRGIAIRQGLTGEWKERGVNTQRDFAILTAEISKATFGMTPSEYKAFKNLPVKSKVNLRDHMSDFELIFTMLGEKVTTEISKNEKPDNIIKHKRVAKRGGKVAGNAREQTENEIGKTVISKQNYLRTRGLISEKNKS